ncbi:MAG: response regulator [Magnetococcus sp. YQC-5]
MHDNKNKDVLQGTILLVDDQPEQLDIIKSALEDFFTVRIATRGDTAIQIALMGGIDLILMDVVMPDISGYDVCRKLKSMPATSDIPIIFLTIKDEYKDEVLGLEIGAVDFIRKPSSPAIILARSRNIISLQRTKEALIQKNEDLQQALKIHEDLENMSRHDIKSPLASILATPYILLSDDNINLTEEHKTLLKIVESSCYAILEIINRSFDLVKMENGHYHLQREAFDIVQVLERVVHDLGQRAATKGIRVEISNTDDDPIMGDPFWVDGEKMLCYPLFYNLVLNAIEASGEKNTVTRHSAHLHL